LLTPKYFITAPWLIKTAITPAIKKAGKRHSITCSRAYHLVRSNIAITASLKLALVSGMKKANKKTADIHKNIEISFFQFIISNQLNIPNQTASV